MPQKVKTEITILGKKGWDCSSETGGGEKILEKLTLCFKCLGDGTYSKLVCNLIGLLLLLLILLRFMWTATLPPFIIPCSSRFFKITWGILEFRRISNFLDSQNKLFAHHQIFEGDRREWRVLQPHFNKDSDWQNFAKWERIIDPTYFDQHFV